MSTGGKKRAPMRLKRFVAYWAIAGLLIPMIFISTFKILSLFKPTTLPIVIALALLQYVLWPSQIMLVGLNEAPLHEILSAIAISVTVNIVVYSVVGSMLWCFLRRSRKPTGDSSDKAQ